MSDDLRAIFDEDAELYDRARPGYPDALFDDLFALAGIGAGSRVLEIGCGTGQATVALAERGCAVVAVELGANLAASRHETWPGIRTRRWSSSAFEDWPLPDAPFDAVVAFTAFHWVDHGRRVEKVARRAEARRRVRHGHDRPRRRRHRAFFVDVQDCYERWDPATPPGLRLEPADEIVPAAVPDPGGRFGAARDAPLRDRHRVQPTQSRRDPHLCTCSATYSPDPDVHRLDDHARTACVKLLHRFPPWRPSTSATGRPSCT